MSQQYQIGRCATTIYNDGDNVCVKYHATTVVRFNGFRIVLNSGGWHTSTTKTRMNQASNQFGLGYRVFQKNFEWFVEYRGKIHDFKDRMELSIPNFNPERFDPERVANIRA